MVFRTFAAASALSLTLAQSQTAPPPPPAASSPLAAAAARAAEARGEVKDAGLGKPVALKFAWPVGMVATVEAERSRTQNSGGATKSSGAGMKYRLRVEPHAQGRLITFDNFESMRTLLTKSESSELESLLASMMPSIVVSKTGDFVRVTDLTKIRAVMKEMMSGLDMTAQGVPANVKAMIENLTSDEVLTNLAAQDWQLLAGAWAGYEGKIGEMTEADSEEPSPVMPGLMVPMRTSFGAVRQTPCEPGRAPDSCVIMQMRSTVAPGGMQMVVRKLLEGSKELGGMTFERFDVVTDLTATIEPATMKPYKITHTRRADFSMRMGRESGSVAQTEQRTYRITYH